jgi:hypothetical protein
VTAPAWRTLPIAPGDGSWVLFAATMHPPTLARTVLVTTIATTILGVVWGNTLLATMGDWRFPLAGGLAAPFGLAALVVQLLWRAWYLRRTALCRRSVAMRRAIYASGPAALGIVLLASLWRHPGGIC